MRWRDLGHPAKPRSREGTGGVHTGAGHDAELTLADTWDTGSSVQRAALARLRLHAESEQDIVDAYERHDR